MKAILIIAILSLYSTGIVKTVDVINQSMYCKGYKVGYVDGYCYEDPWCIKPIVPACPIRDYMEANTWKGGYLRGFTDGRWDAP